MKKPILVLAGGVGGSKLIKGLESVYKPDDIFFVINTADDQDFYGLHVSPDLDTVMYVLSNYVNPETGWGIEGDTFEVLSSLKNFGLDNWFKIGDKDYETHIYRSHLLKKGMTLSSVTKKMTKQLGIEHSVIPMSDDIFSTKVLTDNGIELSFQDYFVKYRCEPRVKEFIFKGRDTAKISNDFKNALDVCNSIIICPSNPFLSIYPILKLENVLDQIKKFDGAKIAISPIVDGKAIKGPADKIMIELGYEPTSIGIAKIYEGICNSIVIDKLDEKNKAIIQNMGYRVEIFDTIMDDLQKKIDLARFIENQF